MTDVDLVKKMLRAVLQSNKNGVSMARLQSDYRSLTGEFIPHKQMGHPTMEGFLRSIPSVVQMERSSVGEVVCFAAVCKETAHIAQLVARQRNSKKAGRSQLVNCQMRVKLSSPFVVNAKPRTSLRQPKRMGRSVRGGTFQSRGSRMSSHGNQQRQVYMTELPSTRSVISHSRSAPSNVQREVHLVSKNADQTTAGKQPKIAEKATKHKKSPPCAGSYDPLVVQNQLKQLLQKYSSGVWVSKLPQLYRDMFRQDLPGHVCKELENWTHVCSVEKPGCHNIVDRLVYPAKDSKPSSAPPSHKPPALVIPKSSLPINPKSPAPCTQTSLSPVAPTSPSSIRPRTPPPFTQRSPASPATVASDVKPKVRELLSKYTHGLWAQALPRLFQDAYKCVFPQRILDDLSLLADTCLVEYPMPDNRKKAILYALPSLQETQQRSVVRQLVVQSPGGPHVPPLLLPEEEHPSVLVVETCSADSVILRFVGEAYSQAQEAMEDAMLEHYSHESAARPVLEPVTGQLVAVSVEEVIRAQVQQVMGEKVKVYYVDHGYCEVVGRSKLLELHEEFLRLPFQASSCKLAGLEPFSRDPEVLKTLESLACGRILLAEILERTETPLVVLYDTSQEEDININSACLKALQEKSMDNPLLVNSTYVDVFPTNVCSDGTVFCQLPSRGRTKLKDVLEKVESFFLSQVTSTLLVSTPFCGQICLARYKGKWSRVEITNLHESRVLDILFVDLGLPASVEVIELREIPPPFLRELLAIPPQALKCCLADLGSEKGPWSPDAVLWLRDAVLSVSECSIKIARLDGAGLVHVYLFTSNTVQDLDKSVNLQLLSSDLWQRQREPPLPIQPLSPEMGDLPRLPPVDAASLPPLLELPQAGRNMDVYVSVACHPGYFVLQPWQDMYKLVVLMGEMVLHYNQQEEETPVPVERNQIYAAKVENSWHRVMVKGVLTNGLVAVYKLDYGKHELVSCNQLRPLLDEFRQLPFQSTPAQLAGVKQTQWSEEAAMVFRDHVEKRPLVAQFESVLEPSNPWERRAVVYLVDTSQEGRDVWIHEIMSEFVDELSKAA
ncbi:tudor domain-containing protein 7A [Chanos chanos]|uniref:Tudor domain-containing protein 7A n=1 Tax=Chanos chanos TaxID=29144 RepID=A0A6J2WJV4_CHACN|nr:tudor domain-containing protein 7A-like [Chanos chanos]